MKNKKVSRWDNFDKKKVNKVIEECDNENSIIQISTHLASENPCDIISNQFTNKDSNNEKNPKYLLITDRLTSFVLQAPNHSGVKTGNQTSFLRNITDIFQIEYEIGYKCNVKIQKLKDEMKYHLDIIELDVKDQFVSRRDQYYINKDVLQNAAVYSSKILYYQGLKIFVSNLMIKDKVVSTGIIVEKTKIIYRTLSAQISILIEVSKEVLDVDLQGEIYYEKIQRFLRVYFQKNLFLQTNHQFTIVLFARLFYPEYKSLTDLYQKLIKNEKKSYAFAFQVDKNGLIYQDVYRCIKVKKSWKVWDKNTSFIITMLVNFLKFLNWKQKSPKILEKIIGLSSVSIDNSINEVQRESLILDSTMLKSAKLRRSNTFKEDKASDKRNKLYKTFVFEEEYQPILEPECELSSSSNSNILESISLILEDYKKYFLGKSLVQTGHSIIVITCGDAQYYVEEELAKLTKENLLLNNVVCNVISFNKEPLFKTPCFVFDKTPNKKNFFIRSKQDISSLFVYNCLDKHLSYKNMLLQDKINVLENELFRNFEGISFEDNNLDRINSKFLEKNNIKLVSTAYCEEIFSIKFTCGHPEHYILEQNDHDILKKSRIEEHENSPFAQHSPYWLKASFFPDESFKIFPKIYDKYPIDTVFSISTRFNCDSNAFHPINSLNKILRSMETNIKNLKGTNINPLEKKIPEILRLERKERAEDDEENIRKAFSDYDKEIFLYPKKIDENILKPNEILNKSPSKKNFKGDNIKEEDNKNQIKQIVSIPLVDESIMQPLPFNLFEMKSYDAKLTSNSNNNMTNSIFKNESNKPKNNNDIKSISKNNEFNLKNTKKKIHSHFKMRWDYFYPCDRIHMLMSQYKEAVKKKIGENSQYDSILQTESIWKDLLMPGLAPMSTNFFPNEKELKTINNGNEYGFSFNQRTEDEVIAQRLAYNFQIVDDNSMDYYGESSKKGNENKKFKRMSFGNIHHKIASVSELKVHYKIMEKIISENKLEIKKLASAPILYKFLVFEDRVGYFTKNSTFLRRVKQMDWKGFDKLVCDDLGEEKLNENLMKEKETTIQILKKIDPKTIKLRLLPIDQINFPKINCHEKIKENFINFFKKLEEKLKLCNIDIKINVSFLEKRKEIQKSYLRMSYSDSYSVHLVSNLSFFAGQTDQIRPNRDFFFFEYQKLCCSKVSYHMNIYWFACSCPIINDFLKVLNATARLAGFYLYYFPHNSPHYKIKSPFDTAITIPLDKNVCKYLKKVIDTDPFNFVYDPENEIKRYIHKKAFLYLEFEEDCLHWRENQQYLEGEDSSGLVDILFEKLNKYILGLDISLPIIFDIVQKI